MMQTVLEWANVRFLFHLYRDGYPLQADASPCHHAESPGTWSKRGSLGPRILVPCVKRLLRAPWGLGCLRFASALRLFEAEVPERLSAGSKCSSG